jgi:hypothetical protein
MAKQTINIGTVANDRSGDPLRTAFTKVNQNFTEVYSAIDDGFSGDYEDLTNKPNLRDLELDKLIMDGPLINAFQTMAANQFTYDCSASSTFLHDSAPASNWTATLSNLDLSIGAATTITIFIRQGNVGYYPSALEIGVFNATIRWRGNVAPTPSTNRVDMVTFTIIDIAGGVSAQGFTVLGDLVGGVEGAANRLINGSSILSLNQNGSLTFPDNTVQTTAYTGDNANTNNSLPYLELTDTPLIVLPSVLGQSVSFSKSPNASNTDPIDTGLTLARGVNGGLFNIVSEEEYDDNLHISPIGTRWNADGWGDLSNIATRSYGSLRSVLNNAIGNNILAAELVMHDTINDKYYKFDFTSWTQNNAGGGFAYTRTLIENPNFFKKDDYATGNNAIDVFVADDGEGSGIAITRDVNQGIYNPFREEEWDSDVSPDGTLWNTDGWDKDDLSNVETRTYDNFDDAYNGNLGNNVPGTKAIMYIPDTGEYYAIHWLSWTQNNAGGGFSYLRYKIDTTKFNEEGITFADGSVLKSAEGLGSVKLRSPGRRRIEEAYGYNEVAVTAINTINLTTLASRNGVDENMFWIDSSNTTIDDIIGDTEAAEIVDETSIQFSLNNSTWYTFSGSISTVNNEKGYGVTLPEGQLLNYDAGDTIYFRYDAGGVPVEWWSKDDLPGGAANFRGAIIDYHAFTGDSTWIGTIHIVDDDGEEHITHTEVQSGSDDGENDDLWHVISEGRIHYRRIDGAAKLLKVQWGAKVFYGSEYWD